jgi:hypothetical protein
MGLLDDAIREHLELKRRRGADLAEVARQEDEALGDPRRGDVAASEAAAEPPVAEPAAGEAVGEPLAREPEPEPDPQEPEPADEAWLEEDDHIGAVASQRTAEFTPPDVEPDPEPARPDAGQEPGDAGQVPEPGADEDVLEETPEFLEETPEHDRLWFEQKPPRDFDFDN